MSNSEKHLYEFGAFVLDRRKAVLTNNGKPVSLTPKMFKLLDVLVANHGDISSKEDLLEQVWKGSFVEEGNLTYTIRQLRKVLGDDAKQPYYIETVPRRGYRFICPINVASEAGNSAGDRESRLNGPSRRTIVAVIAIVMFFACGVTIGATLLLLNGSSSSETSLLNKTYRAQKITLSGNSFSPSISPDGSLVVYVVGQPATSTLFLYDIAKNSHFELYSLRQNRITGPIFSSDGRTIYFTQRSQNHSELDIYRISLLGGPAEFVLSQAQGWIDVSHDQSFITFVRCPRLKDDYCSIWLADLANPSSQQRLFTTKDHIEIGANRISLDNKHVVFAGGESRSGGNEFGLFVTDLVNGETKTLEGNKFFYIRSVEWWPDGNGILATARHNSDTHFRVWFIGFNGITIPLGDDSETVSTLTINDGGTLAVAETIQGSFDITKFDLSTGKELGVQTPGIHGTLNNDKLIFASDRAGNFNIWSQNLDGSETLQLTNSRFRDISPVISPDGETVYFGSNRSGQIKVWAMSQDGSAQRQISDQSGGIPLSITADGQWVYYRSQETYRLWRINTLTLAEELIWDDNLTHYAVSPSGEKIGILANENGVRSIVIYDTELKTRLESFPYPDQNAKISNLFWTPNESSFAYILHNYEKVTPTLWMQDINIKNALPKRMMDFGNLVVPESSSASFSADMKYFFISKGNWKHDVVLISGLGNIP